MIALFVADSDKTGCASNRFFFVRCMLRARRRRSVSSAMRARIDVDIASMHTRQKISAHKTC